MKKSRIALIYLVFTLLFSSLGVYHPIAQEKVTTVSIDKSFLNSGIISVKALGSKKMKLMVEKKNSRYTYILKNNGTVESFPLQMGNGEYKISVLENIEGTKYRYVASDTVKLKLIDDKRVYLNSIQMIKYNDSRIAAPKAKELTGSAADEMDKVKAIYAYIVNNISYDYEKLNKLSSDYLPDIDEVLQNQQGICYDYAALFAAMLRSEGIPVRLVTGFSSNVKGYHAWNEVYMQGEKEWLTIDTTCDSRMKSAGKQTEMIKDSTLYTEKYVY